MIFKSRKGTYFIVVIFLLTFLFLAKIIFKVISENTTNMFDVIVSIGHSLILGFFLWIFFDTKYELTETELRYKSGSIKGQIKLNEINEVELRKYLWSGTRAATAFGGVIIKFRKYDEVYISPHTNELFVKELIIRNSKIKIK